MSNLKKVRLPIEGMTCTGCEEHITEALDKSGAENSSADFRRGEAVFEIDERDLEKAKEAIRETGYKPGNEAIVSGEEKLHLGDEGEYDLLIIGSGGAAFSAAIQAVEKAAKVLMIERGTTGGTCVNIGCVPSKTMLRAGEINQMAASNPFNGLNTSAGSVHLKELTGNKDELVNELRSEKYVNLIDEYGFDFIQGEAKFVDEKSIEVNGETKTAKRIMIATGASPSIPNIPGLNEIDYLTSTTLLQLTELPKRLAVIGSGYIAMELGQMIHNLGAEEVTLMQRSERILKEYDPEVSEAVANFLDEKGIHTITGITTYKRVEQNGSEKRIIIEKDGEEQVITADQVLVATGRTPNTVSLNLEVAGVEIGKKGEVVVDDYLQTTNPRVYAAGDVTLAPQFVYVAAYGGAVIADNALGVAKRKMDLRHVPAVTFTNPSIASIGLTEANAKEEGYNVKTSVLPLEAVPRALVNRETTGVFKLVADEKTNKIIGAHIVAENAGDIIYAATLAVKFGLTIEDLNETLCPYLTMAEGMKLAALTFDKDVSKLSCCAG
ncbi:mercury(II) reductase [Aquibacillus sp. 3ASR75-11]|uniref:Mercuric reductase n=1 Tax=Terrihalobacillus insolitus TaxID=2950438 RepID=A0A9X3WXT2_9BACI|nr:mercury(II) reductase [Terrihalobacillus insolitus]MDC3414459.1 mercury(II) reductase [Terrihalobacillus insolitus]MDC3425339.1 mercury(II) reductase [Terrihalobacillus insolitus]